MSWTMFFLLPAVLLVLSLIPAPAQAQARVFVAAQGSDSNPCTFAQPCRTFQKAHDTVAAGGEIDVLDPAGYGALIISKAISIQGHGFAGVSVPNGGTGIYVNAGPSDAVSLNGLLIEGNGTGQNGIFFLAGKSLVVENCVARNATFAGLRIESNAAALQTLAVSSSSFANNGQYGIVFQPNSTGAITAVIDRVGLYNN